MTTMWITLNVGQGNELLDARNFMIQENGRYLILLVGGSSREGPVSEIRFILVETVLEN